MKGTGSRIREICDGYLRKPVSKADLFLELGKFLEHSPISTGENQTDPTDAPVVQELDPDASRKLAALLQLLQGEMKNTWQELRDTWSINDIEDFANRLKELGTEYGYDPLVGWARNLASQAAIYDVEQMPETMEKFPRIIKELEILLSASPRSHASQSRRAWERGDVRGGNYE
jgi:hypothetical protein